MTRTRTILSLWVFTFVQPVFTALTVDTAVAGTKMLQRRGQQQQQPEPEGDMNSTLTPFTHSHHDYYTNPYDTSNDDDDDAYENTSKEISIQTNQLSREAPMSIVTILWIAACISIVLLLTSCILLGTTQRNRRKIHHQQQRQAEKSINMDATTCNAVPTSKSKSQSQSQYRITSTTTSTDGTILNGNKTSSSDMEEGQLNKCIAIIDDHNDLQFETDTTTSSDTTATIDASSSLSSLSL